MPITAAIRYFFLEPQLGYFIFEWILPTDIGLPPDYIFIISSLSLPLDLIKKLLKLNEELLVLKWPNIFISSIILIFTEMLYIV